MKNLAIFTHHQSRTNDHNNIYYQFMKVEQTELDSIDGIYIMALSNEHLLRSHIFH